MTSLTYFAPAQKGLKLKRKKDNEEQAASTYCHKPSGVCILSSRSIHNQANHLSIKTQSCRLQIAYTFLLESVTDCPGKRHPNESTAGCYARQISPLSQSSCVPVCTNTSHLAGTRYIPRDSLHMPHLPMTLVLQFRN